ncbi:glycosyltransferase [Candidatus Shapirobacteria bacterium]|nr:glycosyltransferase [Candidatus Shapirobacteria bacterium]
MGKTTKKALIYDPYLDTLGGGERYCLTVGECLLKKGWKVDFWWRGKDVLSKAKQRFGLSLKGLRVISSDLRPLFKRLKLTRSYDLIFWLSDGSLPFLLSNNNIVHFQVPFKNTSTNKLLDKVKLKLVDHVVCNSEFTKKFIDQEYGTKSKVLYPPIDVTKFKPGKKEKIILAVGRFEETMQAKKQDVLIRAFKKMVDGGLKDWRLVLIGGSLGDPKKNKYLADLKSQARDYLVKFLVNASFSELKKQYAQGSFFWHAAGFGVDEEKEPWRVEHFGMTTVEAMAAGCVPLVINKGGLKEIVRRGEGERWEGVKELVKKTEQLIKGNSLYVQYQKAAILRAQEFSKEKFCRRFVGALGSK